MNTPDHWQAIAAIAGLVGAGIAGVTDWARTKGKSEERLSQIEKRVASVQKEITALTDINTEQRDQLNRLLGEFGVLKQLLVRKPV